MVSIETLEHLSLSMWNAAEEYGLDGWLLRFSGGFSGRANSVQTFSPIHRPLAEAVDTCEAEYAKHQLPTIFKLTNITQPPDLESYLIEKGYFIHHRTSVQTCSLADWTQTPPTNVQWVTGNATPDGQFPPPVAAWMHDAQAVKQLSPADDAQHRAILARLSLPVAYGGVFDAGQMVAMGICVIAPHDGICGLFDIGVHPDHRRKGHGRTLTAGLMAWGKAQGAHTAYLQVDTANDKALPLYAALGFVECYQYWYRHQPIP